MPVRISRCLSVDGGASQQPWVIADVETVDGTEFVQLSVGDSGFNRFVTGTSKGLHRKSGFLSKLRELRTKATIKACCKCEGEDLFGATAAALKKQRTQSKEVSKRGDTPPVVKVRVPQVEHDGIVIAAFDMQMKSSLDISCSVRVHAIADNLEYVRLGILSEDTSDRAVKQKTDEEHIRWRHDRSCFLATKNVEGTCVTKTFRPTGDDEASKATALSKAKEWLNEE